MYPKLSAIVNPGNRIVIAVGKKVFVVQVPFCCQNIGCIRIQKPADLRVIVAVMQVIQPRLRIQIVATIAEGVQVGNIVRTSEFLPVSVLYGDGIAPAVIEVPYPQAAVAEVQRFHIAAGVGLYIVNIPSTIMIITDAGKMAVSIIGIVELLAVAPLFIHQLAILIPVPVLFAVDCFAGAQPIGAILVYYGCTIFCELCQLSAIPAHAHAVAIGERVADFVAGDALTVIPCQQVFPLAVIGIGDGVCGFAQFAGGIGVNGAAGQVASAVIGIDHRCIEIPVVFPGQLSQCIVFIGNFFGQSGCSVFFSCPYAFLNFCDVAHSIIGIPIGSVTQKFIAKLRSAV